MKECDICIGGTKHIPPSYYQGVKTPTPRIYATACRKEAQLMLTNPRDAFRGQARSHNTVPYDMLGIVSHFCVIVT